MEKKTVLIAGGRGFIGRSLAILLTDMGFDVLKLTRTPKKTHHIIWNPKKKFIQENLLHKIDIVVNLLGENIGEGRWTEKRKKLLFESRIDTTTFLCEITQKMPKLSYYVGASAIDCYGKEGDRVHIETDAYGDDFLANLIKEWEASTDTLASKINVGKIRIPIVLSRKNGALSKIKKIINAGLGCPLGSGKQTMPWVHLDDLCRLFAFAINGNLNGVYNAHSNSNTNKTFMKALAARLNRPFFLPSAPSFLLKLILGEKAIILLNGTKVSNKKIIDAGFIFQYTNIKTALNNC